MFVELLSFYTMSRKNPDPDSITAGLRLARAITLSTLSRQQFADAMGIGTDTVSRLIAGKAPRVLFDHRFRKRCCTVLGCTMADLDGDTVDADTVDGAENPESKSTRSSSIVLPLLMSSGLTAAALAGTICLACLNGEHDPRTARHHHTFLAIVTDR